MGDGDVESKLKECDDHRTTQDECSIDDEGAPHQLPGRAKVFCMRLSTARVLRVSVSLTLCLHG